MTVVGRILTLALALLLALPLVGPPPAPAAEDVKIALVAPLEACVEAARRIRQLIQKL